MPKITKKTENGVVGRGRSVCGGGGDLLVFEMSRSPALGGREAFTASIHSNRVSRSFRNRKMSMSPGAR